MLGGADPALYALDPRSLGALRHAAKGDANGSLRTVAQQFESMFMNILLKSMRSTTEGGIFDSEHSRLYTELADQQVAQKIATTGKGLGIADMLLAQMHRGAPAAPGSEDAKPIPLRAEAAPIPLKTERGPIPLKATLPGSDMMPLNASAQAQPASAGITPREFVAAVWDPAARAGQELGVAPHALVAQAALESGWGKREIRLPDGSGSHNLFGIKAGPEWQGKTAEVVTTEYVNGAPQKQVARFRAYDSYADAFADYARLLKTSPCYAQALQAADGHEFAAALQRAGYATDPAYAAKLSRVMGSETLRQALLA